MERKLCFSQWKHKGINTRLKLKNALRIIPQQSARSGNGYFVTIHLDTVYDCFAEFQHPTNDCSLRFYIVTTENQMAPFQSAHNHIGVCFELFGWTSDIANIICNIDNILVSNYRFVFQQKPKYQYMYNTAWNHVRSKSNEMTIYFNWNFCGNAINWRKQQSDKFRNPFGHPC